MQHVISIKSQEFVQSLKDAVSYLKKDGLPDDPLAHVVLTVNPRQKKLAIIGCDGLGYYERRLNLTQCKGKPSLPNQNTVCIAASDVITLVKAIPARATGYATLEFADENLNDGQIVGVVHLGNGLSTTFHAKTNLRLPDFTSIKTRAEKGRKQAVNLANVQVPVNELLRAGKVFPGKRSFAQLFTARGVDTGIMALLECKDELTDISVIFMLNQQAAA